MYRSELLLGTDDFDIDATVRLQASNNLGALRSLALIGLGDWLLAALAFGVDAVGRDALADQVVLDGSGALLGQFLVVRGTTDTVSVTNGDDYFENQLVGLGDDVVKLGLAFRAQGGLVEVEQCVGGDGYLLAGGGRAGFGRVARSAGSGCLRFANLLRQEILVTLATSGILGSGGRGPEVGASAETEWVHDDFATTIDGINAINCLCLRQRGAEAKGYGQQGHHGMFCCFIHLDSPR